MTDIRVGEKVVFRDRVYLVRGISPMGATTKRVMLEDTVTKERLVVAAVELRRHEGDDAAALGSSG